jgi:hypothetical protein
VKALKERKRREGIIWVLVIAFCKISFPIKHLMAYYAKTGRSRPPNRLTVQIALMKVSSLAGTSFDSELLDFILCMDFLQLIVTTANNTLSACGGVKKGIFHKHKCPTKADEAHSF